MKFTKTTLAASLAIAATLGSVGQATAGIYAGSSLMVDNLTIDFVPESFPNDPNIGQFDFTVTSTADVSGTDDSAIEGCSGNVGAGTTTCGDGGAGTPVLYDGAPADVNAGATPLDTQPLNTVTFEGPGGDGSTSDYAYGDAIIDTAALVDAANFDIITNPIPIRDTATRQIAEAELSSVDQAFSNTDISSATSFTLTFELTDSGSIIIAFDADPSLLAQFDDSSATDATSQADMEWTAQLVSNNAADGPINVSWAPTIVTGGACTSNLTGFGVTCEEEIVEENLNGDVTAPGPLPFSEDQLSRLSGDVGFGSYKLELSGLSAGDYSLGLNAKTSASVTRVQAVPEPSMLLLLGTGLAMCGVSARRRKTRKT